MKFIHLSDLHLGKRVNEFPMLEDQAYILKEVLSLLDAEQPDALVIAGDVYDRSIPPAEAVTLLDEFLVEVAQRKLPTLIISGNHDSAERLAFAGRLMEKNLIYISPAYNGAEPPVTLTDEYGPVDFYLLPFVKPGQVRRCFPEEEIDSYTDAVGCAIRAMNVDPARRSVLVTHQFVAGSTRCESEELSVGGTDSVDAALFEPFDYVALGHLHGPQNVAGDRVRYCGTLLPYSFSEVHHHKSVTIVELGEKGQRTVRTVELKPLRAMAEVRGTYLEVSSRPFYETVDRDAYIRVTLTDEEDVPDAVGKLRRVYPNLMRLDYDNRRTRSAAVMPDAAGAPQATPLELFEQLYEQQNGGPMEERQRAYLEGLIENIWEVQA